MIPEKVFTSSNPYHPLTPKLSSRQFYGRKKDLDNLFLIIDEYKKTSNIQNVIISGDKSIGKTSLLLQYKKILEGHNFYVFNYEITRSDDFYIDEFEFFKDLIDDVFERFAPPDGKFFDEEQCDIWFSLTRGNFEHTSNFIKRKINFATKYANKKKGIDEIISYIELEKDFSRIIDEIILSEMDIIGFAILIDEFQELSKNPVILDCLRKLSENLDSLIIIGSGLPTYLDNPLFEKFSRTSYPINLNELEPEFVMDLIFEPLQNIDNYTRFEVKKWFDPDSVSDIIDRSAGNPLHIKVICSKIFEFHKTNNQEGPFRINREIMDQVMEFYSSISNKSRKIRLSLQSFTRNQLESFRFLYDYAGLSIRAAILVELAFDKITFENEEIVKNKFLNAFSDLKDSELFVFNNGDTKFEQLQDMNSNQLSHVEFNFIGDSIDGMYAFYYFEDLTKERLTDNFNASFEDRIAAKYSDKVDLDLIKLSVSDEVWKCLSHESSDLNIRSRIYDVKQSANEIIEDLGNLVKMSSSDKEEDKKTIQKLSKLHNLEMPSFMSSVLDLNGFILVVSDLYVKGKRKIIYNLFPIFEKEIKINELKIEYKELNDFNLSLHEYMVSINSAYLFWLPSRTLNKIARLDIENLYQRLIDATNDRDFDRAAQVSFLIMSSEIRFKQEGLYTSTLSSNNHAFCLLNINQYDSAIEILEQVHEKEAISKVNLAYAYFCKGRLSEAKNILSKFVRKGIGLNEDTRYMNLCIKHENIENKNLLVKDCLLYNVAAWNAALINAQMDGQQAITRSFAKKYKFNKNDEAYNKRVMSWILFFEKQYDGALDLSIKAIKNIQKDNFLYDDLLKDQSVFKPYTKIELFE